MADGSQLGICLQGLAAREEAVIKRVISFSGSQGRNYALAALEQARILVVSDDTPVDFANLPPDGCMIIRIADQNAAEPYDVLMTRPLLVTRVMRTLDEASALLQESRATARQHLKWNRYKQNRLARRVNPLILLWLWLNPNL
ncbi:MAG: hypothetical protein R3E89_08970 [Thiolinea sp.]